MNLDKYSNPIFNEQDLFDALYKGYKLNPADIIFVDEPQQFQNLSLIAEHQFFPPIDSSTLTVSDFNHAMQESWNMPDEYKQMDIENWLVQNSNKEHYERLIEELNAFKERNMLDLLRWLKYFVDTCEKEGIVWGVGRGSSVASYILYVIGVHSIDPIKYNLNWHEFLR